MPKLNKRIVSSVYRPRTCRYLIEIDELPVTQVYTRETQVVSHRRRNIQSSIAIWIGMWTLVPENILPIIRSEWADIFPLGVTNPVPMPNGNPFAFADRLAISNEGASEPRNYLRDFRFGVMVRDVIVRQSDIKWILPGKKIGWNKIRSSPRGRVVVPTIAREPTSIPGALIVGNRIVSACLFTYPEDRGCDVHFPVNCTGQWLSARG